MIKIALDGPGGAGKSSLAKALAKAYQFVYVDTGALYRTVGLYVRRRETDPHDEDAVAALLPDITLTMDFVAGEQHIYLCGEDVGDQIRTPEMSLYASAVSALPPVRQFLLQTQRRIAQRHHVVMDGRDIGTVIFPDADVKIFLTARPEDRAQRRYLELRAKGMDVSYEQVLSEMLLRDRNDSGRSIAPLKPAPDAVILDNTGFEPAETFAAACAIIDQKLGKHYVRQTR